MDDPNNLEGPPRTPEELAENFRELQRVAPRPVDRFRLMFGQPPLTSDAMKLPDNLPPLPPVPEGFDRWEYRGIGWRQCKLASYCTTNTQQSVNPSADDWIFQESRPLGAQWLHYIEAVRDQPADDHRDCRGGCLYGHETGGWPNRVCPHGECWRNQQEEVRDEPASEATGIEAMVCADITARQRLGIAKYGVTVKDSPDDMLRHAYEESLDLAVYLKAELERRNS